MTPVQVDGVILEPFNPLAVAIALDASFVARAYVGHADETRAIPVSRPESGDSDVATEKLNARGKQSGGVSAQDLLRREGRL